MTWDSTPLAELGVCVDVALLVPGDVGSVRGYGERLRRVADGAGGSSSSSAWLTRGAGRGWSGDTFRAVLAASPAPYSTVAQALGTSAGATSAYADVIEDARVVAHRAVRAWGEADIVSQRWAGDAPDPGDELRRRATAVLSAAQHEVAVVAARTERTLLAAADLALDGPTTVDSLRSMVMGPVGNARAAGQLAVALAVDPGDTSVALLEGARDGVTNPLRVLQETWAGIEEAPAESFGSLLFGGAVTRLLRPPGPGPMATPVLSRPGLAPWLPWTRPAISAAAWAHVLLGEFDAEGQPMGYHHRPGGVDAQGRTVTKVGKVREDGTSVGRDILFTRPDGTTTTERMSTYFPDEWSQERVRAAIDEAWAKPIVHRNDKDQWWGWSGRMRVGGFVASDDTMATAYPMP